MQIAIDGPAGSGKSSISKILSEKLGFVYLDTGSMYRAAAWLSIKHDLLPAGVGALLKEVTFNFFDNGRSLSLSYMYDKTAYQTDVTALIRTPEVTKVVSAVSADKGVRDILTKKQQEIAHSSNVIMDGRDIGTVVLPKADFKFYLTASSEERARRRAKEWNMPTEGVEFDKILIDMVKRDDADSTRELSPLKKADDAKEIDTTRLTMDEVIEIIAVAVKKTQLWKNESNDR